MQLENHAVITGGTGALGQAIAGALVRSGWVVSAPGSRELDVTDKDAIERFFDRKPLDLLVCAAGMTTWIDVALTTVVDRATPSQCAID